MNISLSSFVSENLVSRDGFGSPVPRQPAHLHTQAESGAYLRDSSRVPRRRLSNYLKAPYSSTGPLTRNTYFEQGLKPYCPRGCKRNFLIHHFLLLAKNIEYCTYSGVFLISPVSYFQRSNFLLLLTAVIVFFFSILWSLPFSRRIFVASTSPVHCGIPLPDFDTFRGTGWCRISQLYRYVCTVRTDRRPFLVPTSNPISCFLSPGARY